MGLGGVRVATLVLVLALLFVLFATIRLSAKFMRPTALIVIAISSFALPGALIAPSTTKPVGQDWVEFNRSDTPRLISQGKTVFVDVTADWCLTCKANKALVLDRTSVADRLRDDTVVAMQADWTRPNPEISRYLETHNRFGIPFNVAYGPYAPEGMILSEVLTTDAVLHALDLAARRDTISSPASDN